MKKNSKENCWFWKSPRNVLLVAGFAMFAGVYPPALNAQNFTLLYQFAGTTDGLGPQNPIVRDSSGNLYGATVFSDNGIGDGTIFRVSSSGKFTLLHTFQGGVNGDGA